MSVQLTGTYGFFTRAGAFIGEYNRVAAQYGSDLTSGFQSIWTQFASSNQAAVENLPSAVAVYRNTGVQYQNTLQADANLAALLQVADTESVNPYTFPQAINVVRNQMALDGSSINRPTLGSSVTGGASNDGDTVVVVSTTNIFGEPLDMTYNETFALTVTQSGTSFTGSVAAVGQLAVGINSYNWPQGSGASATVPITDPATDGVVTDGGYADWEGTGDNTPTNWDILNGSAGVTVFKSVAGGVRTGTDAAQITSDGSQATQLAQNVSLQINTVYAVTFQAKINTITGTGTFRIALSDGDGNILTDDAGTSLSYTRDLNGQIDTTYTQFTAFFSTPRQLPETVRVQIGTSVAATAGRVITFDLVQIVAATALYGPAGTGTYGPFCAAFAGVAAPATGDTYSVVFTNSLGTQSFVWGSERLYGMRANGLYYPSSVSPNISDSLVTH